MKIFKQILCIFLILAGCIPISVMAAVPALAYDEPEIQAQAALLIESTTGTVLYAKNADESIPPASTTKIMTVLVAAQACSENRVALSDFVTVSKNALSELGKNVDDEGLKAGEKISLEDLLYYAALDSSNESCNAIAEHVSGSIEAFTAEMNALAEKLGCTGTHFSNTHGLSDDNHYTTANDLYLIMAEGLKNPIFTEIFSTNTYEISGTNLSEPRKIYNSNDLLQEESQYYYDNAILGKTGYTDSIGHSLVSVANDSELNLVCVLLGTQNFTDENGITYAKNFSETIRLFDWGFSNFSYQTILSPSDLIADIPVKMGDGSDSVILCPAETIRALVNNDEDSSEFQRQVRIFCQENGEELVAPIHVGDVLGTITVTYKDKEYGTVNLVANTNINLQRIEFIKLSIKKTLGHPIVKLVFWCIVLLIALYIVYIVRYNRKRAQKRSAAAKRNEVLHSKEIPVKHPSTIGKSFEDIEEIYKNKQNISRK